MNRSTTSKRDETNSPQPFVPLRIISGGQTGVDRAGLDVAIALGIEHGGWCPKGRVSEDGTVPSRYELIEVSSRDYRVRTERNVLESDATLILYERSMGKGTALTRRLCHDHSIKMLVVNMVKDSPGKISQWLLDTTPGTLNVAGPRESSQPGIHERSMAFLLRALTEPSQ